MMTRPPVEELPDVAWARVEREVFARLGAGAVRPRASRRRWWWLAVPAVAAAAAAVLLLLLVRTPAPAVTWSRVVATSSPSTVMFDDADIVLDPQSAVVFQHAAEQPMAVLESGAAWFSVAPRAGRPPFMVLAGATVVRVIGTRFRVARSGERTDVLVDHGIVEVQHAGEIVRLTAGQAWSSDVPVVPPAPAPAPAIAPPAPPKAASAAPAAGVPPAPSAQHRYEALAQLEPTQPDAAMHGYLELARGGDRWAALALYSAGRLAADRGDARARSLLLTYRRRFPDGANAADVAYLLDRLQGAHP